MRRSILLLSAMALMVVAYTGVAFAAPVDEAEPNDSTAQAQNIDPYFSMEDNPEILNSTTVPHASVRGTGNETYDYYSFMVPQAGTSTVGVLDIDGAMYSFDATLELYDSNGNRLAYNDDSSTDPGSAHPYDSFISYRFPTAGTYYAKVGEFPGYPVPSGGSYRLHVSVPNHSVTPRLNLPSDIIEEATGLNGAQVSWQAPTATDENPASPAVTCSKNPGDTFPLGTTTVTCEATDADGNKATGSFDVTVRDTTAPAITSVPQDKTQEATGPNGAQVSWTAPTASDAVDGAVDVECTPASGSTFALGQTTVSCTATDSRNNSDTETFTVTVRDTTAPQISGMPQDITANATGSSGARVGYASPTATDLVDGAVSVNCSPASGSVFSLGSTQVSCSATDSRNNSDTKTFKVSVLYEWAGFFSPINNPEWVNKAKAGQAIPVKFSLGGDMGLGVFFEDANGAYPRSAPMACDSTDPVDAIEQTVSAGSSSLSYDALSGRYNYVWKTNGAWAGTCRQLVVKLDDGTVQRANFKFTK